MYVHVGIKEVYIIYAGLPQQNRGMYQGGDNMMSPNTPQAILMQQQQQQQQQQQAAMMNRGT